MTWVNAVIAGVLTGGAYSIMGVSIALMFRSTGVLSFAHAAFAMLAAYLYSDLTIDKDLEPVLASAIALTVTVAYGLLTERLAIRPVERAGATAKLIATVAVLGATTALMLLVYGPQGKRAPLLFPDGGLRLGDVFAGYQQLGVLVVAGATGVALAGFLKATRLGLAVRATADNAAAAALVGIPRARISQFNWALGALTAGIAGVLVAPSTIVSVASFPLLELRALVATLFGGLGYLGLTFAGGLLIGALESVAAVQFSVPGVKELVVLLVVVGVLLVRRQWFVAEEPPDAFAGGVRGTLPRWFPARVASTGPIVLRVATGAAALAFAVLAFTQPSGSDYWSFVWGLGIIYAVEALSLVLLSGWGGQVTLMQGAYVGMGAYGVLYFVNEQGLGPELAVVASVALTTAAGALAGIPALRVTGPQFAIVSLAFLGTATTYVFTRSELQGTLPRGTFLGIDITSDRSLYFLMLAVTAVLFALVWNVRRSRFGTFLIASRDAPDMVNQFGSDPQRTRMAAFVLASAIAGLGGAMYALLFTGFRAGDFGIQLSIALVMYAVVGGVTSLAGPLIAGVVFGVVPQLLQQETDTGSGAQRTALIASLVVVAMVALRPTGLAGLWLRPATAQGATIAGRPLRPDLAARLERRRAPVRLPRATWRHTRLPRGIQPQRSGPRPRLAAGPTRRPRPHSGRTR